MVAVSFINFLGKNLTLTVIASLVIFNLLNVFVYGIVTPMIMTYLDPDHNLSKLNVTINGKYVIKYGKFIQEFFIAISLLLILSQLDRLQS
jgi:large-conductance mechanosensitive channel